MKQGKIPMYQVIANDLKQRILEGRMNPEEPLPTQVELAKQFQTSEITSRRALEELVKAGYIHRIRGKGSFISRKGQGLDSLPLNRIWLTHASLPMRAFDHRFYAGLTEGIREGCEAAGIRLQLWDMGESLSLPPCDQHTGIILLPGPDLGAGQLRSWKGGDGRLVTVQYFYPQLQIPSVTVDNLTGGFLATEHLLALGHRRIGIILTGSSFLEMNQEFALRLQGYKQALSQYNVPFDPQLVAIMPGHEETEEMGASGAEQLLSLSEPPTALFATSDYKAAGACRAAERWGLQVPGQISVVGYDDAPAGPLLVPPLTTISQNSPTVGRRAVEILLHEWHAIEAGQSVKEGIAPSLIVRGSTGKRYSP